MNGHRIEAGEYMTPKQAKDALGISAQRISDLFREGRLPFIDLGTTKLIRVEDVERRRVEMRKYNQREMERLRRLEGVGDGS